MQSGILIKDSAVVKAKIVYGGDISQPTMQAEILRLQEKYPNYSVFYYESDQDETFLAAEVTSPIQEA